MSEFVTCDHFCLISLFWRKTYPHDVRRFFKFKRKKKLGIIFCEVCQCQRLKQIKGPNKLICVIFFKCFCKW